MDTRLMSVAPQARARMQDVFILPELLLPREEGLALLILTDGNNRGGRSGGYVAGARRVVAIAEHLARRPDVAVFIACVLSPDNIAKRSDRFFLAVYKEFIRLGVEIETRGALVAAGVRIEVAGDLRLLRARKGHGETLADAIEAVAEKTTHVTSPALRLVLGVGYDRALPREHDVDILLRTGMEEEGALRLSGLDACPRMLSYATTKLWPDIEPADVDEVLNAAKLQAAPVFAGGHTAKTIIELTTTLAEGDLEHPVAVTVAAATLPGEVPEALEYLFVGALRGSAAVAVRYAGDELCRPRWFGPRASARHEIHVIRTPRQAKADVYAALVAPGQRYPALRLPEWPRAGYANVHPCEATPRGIFKGIRAAQRYGATNVSLLGAERDLAADRHAAMPAPRSEGPCPEPICALLALSASPQRDPGGEATVSLPWPSYSTAAPRESMADVFAATVLRWGERAGLLLPDVAFRRAALNYALTAFITHYRVAPPEDDAHIAWMPRALLSARYMLLVAASDDGCFDRASTGEPLPKRAAERVAAASYLAASVDTTAPLCAPPNLPDAALLQAIATQWRAIVMRYQRHCRPLALELFRASVKKLYAASVAEYDPEVTDNPLVPPLGAGMPPTKEAASIIEARYGSIAPPCVAARLREILARPAEDPRELAAQRRELAVLLYLIDAADAIGAGLLFRTAALATPAEHVTDEMIGATDALGALLDYRVRIANDLSGFLDFRSGDRDAKKNSCSILIPSASSGALRGAAVVDAVTTCRQIAAWLEQEIARETRSLAASFRYMAMLVRRGMFVGGQVYATAHYTTLSREQMSGIWSALEDDS
jgi:undecaprenyl pyrophosphate synthase